MVSQEIQKNVPKILDILSKEKGNTMLADFRKKKYTPWMMLISTIMSARSKDETTAVISKNLFKEYPDAKALASAKQEDVEKIIKKIGFYRNKAKNIINSSKMIVEDFKGKVPDNFEGLLQLPGVGRKVAGCVMVYAFQKDAIPTDIHVHRISNRLGWVETKMPEQTEQELMKLIPKSHWQIVNDNLVSLGKTICKPITPLCSKCVVEKYCEKVGVEKSK